MNLKLDMPNGKFKQQSSSGAEANGSVLASPVLPWPVPVQCDFTVVADRPNWMKR